MGTELKVGCGGDTPRAHEALFPQPGVCPCGTQVPEESRVRPWGTCQVLLVEDPQYTCAHTGTAQGQHAEQAERPEEDTLDLRLQDPELGPW